MHTPQHSPEPQRSPDVPAGTYWLHQDIVFAIQERGPGILVQRLHVVPGGQRWPVVHTAA